LNELTGLTRAEGIPVNEHRALVLEDVGVEQEYSLAVRVLERDINLHVSCLRSGRDKQRATRQRRNSGRSSRSPHATN
jgi:hypothetical protein